LEAGLADRLEDQMVADQTGRLFLGGLVGDLAVYFPVSQEEGLMVGR